MGRACVCCGDECLNDVIHLNVDRYPASVRSFVETRVDTYELTGSLDDRSFFVPTSIDIISTESENTIDNDPFVSNTFRSVQISSDYVVVNGERIYTQIWKKTTLIRKLALSFNVNDVFDWDKKNKYDRKFIDAIYFRLGNIAKKDMDNGPWSYDWSDETTTSAFFGIFNEDLPASISVFNDLISGADYQFDIVGMSNHAAVDVDSFFERGNTKYLILLTPTDREVKDGFLDQEPDENGEYRNYWDSINDTKIGSIVGLGDWGSSSGFGGAAVENKIWLELIRPGSKDAAASRTSFQAEALGWLADVNNIPYDWHDCFERIAEAEYVSTCKYMDVYFDFNVFNDTYFQEGSKLEIELFKPKTSNTKLGARKTEALLLYELQLNGNVVEEILNNPIAEEVYRTEDGIEYRFHTGEYCDGYVRETLPTSEWVNWKTAKIEEDCTKELVGEIPELRNCANQYDIFSIRTEENTFKLKDKELFEWNLKYSIDGTKDLIMAQYRNPCDSFDVESQIGCEEVVNCGFTKYFSYIENVGDIFIRDCVLETTPGYYKEGEEGEESVEYTHAYSSRYPIHGSYDPLNVRLQLIDHQYYPNDPGINSSSDFELLGQGISIKEVQNTRTGNNPTCPVIECVGGPAILEWEFVDEEFIDLSTDVTFEEHNATRYGIYWFDQCTTRIAASKKKKENVGGSISRHAYSSSTTVKYVPSSEEAWMFGSSNYLRSIEASCGCNRGQFFYDYNDWVPFGSYSYTCWSVNNVNINLTSFGAALGGSWSTSIPCEESSIHPKRYCNGVNHERIDLSNGEFYRKVYVGYVVHNPNEFILGTEFGTHTYHTSIPSPTNRYFIFDAFIHEEYTLEEYDNITDWDNDVEMATVHTISVKEEPFVYSETLDNVFGSNYDRDIRDVVLSGRSKYLEYIATYYGDGSSKYVPGYGIRFRLQEEFLTCEYEENFSTFSDFDSKYQWFAPVIIQDAQLDEDQVGEIAGYLTDFNYWYQIQGTFFIEHEDGEDLSEDDEGNIIVGTYVTDKWFYVDDAGNINGPFDESGFVETLPDFAVYDTVQLRWDGISREVVAERDYYGNYEERYAGGIDSEYIGSFNNRIGLYSWDDYYCHNVVDGSSYAYESQFPDSITTDCFLAKQKFYAGRYANSAGKCPSSYGDGGYCHSNNVIGPNLRSPDGTFECLELESGELISDGYFITEPGVNISTATISETITFEGVYGSDPFAWEGAGWSIHEAGNYCPSSPLWTPCEPEAGCSCREGLFREKVTKGGQRLNPGDSINLSFEIPVGSNVIPDETWDHVYEKGDSVNYNKGFTVETTGFYIPEGQGTHYYKKTVPRFSCGNLPEITFTGDDLLFSCEYDSSISYDSPHMSKQPLPYINVLKNSSWDLTSKYGISKRGRFNEWEDIIAGLEEILETVEWDVLDNVTEVPLFRYRQLDPDLWRYGSFECSDGCYGRYRVDSRDKDDLRDFYQKDNYDIDLTFDEAFRKFRESPLEFGNRTYERFINILASYKSGYNFCQFSRGIYSDQQRVPSRNSDGYPSYDSLSDDSCKFGCEPAGWYAACPYERPANKMPGDEYRIFSDDYEGFYSTGCGEDKGGIFDFEYLDDDITRVSNDTDPFGLPTLYNPWGQWGYWSWYYGYYGRRTVCSGYSQLNKYEKLDNKNYTFTIKGMEIE